MQLKPHTQTLSHTRTQTHTHTHTLTDPNTPGAAPVPDLLLTLAHSRPAKAWWLPKISG